MTKKVTVISLFMCLLFSATLTQAQVEYDDAGYNAVLEAGLVQEFNLSQGQDDIQVMLRHVYADENRVIVEYSASATGEIDFPSAVSIQLEDADGTLYAPYDALKRGYGGGEMGSVWMQALVSYRVGEHWDTLDGNFIITITVEETPFVFEVSVPVNPAVRIIYDQTATAGNMTIRLGEVSVSESMTVAAVCYILPNQQQAWTPRGTIQVMDASADMLTQEPHARPNDMGESCFEMFVALPMTFGNNSVPPISIYLEALSLARPYTLDNVTEFQTRASEIGVVVEIIDNGSPIAYSYTIQYDDNYYSHSTEISALENDILYDHIVGPWTFESLGIP